MKFILSALTIMLLLPNQLMAQYTQQGKIQYERKVNIHAQLDAFGDNQWIEQARSQTAKFKTTNFELSFNMDKSIYKLQGKPDDKADYFTYLPASENTVLTNFKTQQVTASKLIFEKTFLVKDTMRTIQWRITNEIRTIGDYKCRKAVGKICDSVYVVAFYADDIMVSGGPEMFGGLPGMILELAIPRLHTTWTATKIEVAPPKPEEMTVSSKGKQVTEKELYETLKSSFSDWVKTGDRNIWWSLL